MKPRILLIVATKDSISKSEVKAPYVTDAMYDAAWDLIYTMTTGKRRKPAPRFKKYREQNEREAAKAVVAKAKARKLKKRTKLTKPKGPLDRSIGAFVEDPFQDGGIHSMVEGNRGDHQT